MKIIVAIPCYNCELQIARVLAELTDEIMQTVHQVVIIDNRSTDQTRQAARQAIGPWRSRFGADRVLVVENRVNYGLGGSHKAAFQYALAERADYVAILHGDNQAKSDELMNLIRTAQQDPEAAAILGARFHWRSRLQGYSKIRILGNVGLNLLYSLFWGRLILDLGSGLNLFAMSTLQDRAFLKFDNGFTFNMDLLLGYLSQGAPLHYVPITWRETDQVSNAKALQVGWKTLKKLFQWRFGGGPSGSPQQQDYVWDPV